MQLKYHDDITWRDLPKIERPTMALSTVRFELSRPLSGLRGPMYNDPLKDIYRSSSHDIDPYALDRLLNYIEEARVLLVRTFEGDTPYPAFVWKVDEQHPDKGHFVLGEHILANAEFRLEILLSMVKRPQQIGSIKPATVTTAEYGYIPSTNTNPQSKQATSPVISPGETKPTPRPPSNLPKQIPGWEKYQPASNDSQLPSDNKQNLIRIGRGFTVAGLTTLLAGDTKQPASVRWEDTDNSYLFYPESQRLSVYDKPSWYPSLRTSKASYTLVTENENTWFKDNMTGDIVAGIDPENGNVLSTAAMERVLKLSYDDYKANGGGLSYNDWLAMGGGRSLIDGVTPNKEPLKLFTDPDFVKRVNDVDCTDCDDLARMLYKASGENGEILDFTTPTGTIKVKEFGVVEEFVDHRVYSDGNFVFDPRYSSEPVPVSKFVSELKELNPDLVIKDITH